MTTTYNSNNTAGAYNKARLIPESTMGQWMDFLTASVSPIDVETILDLGCGTGRFSYALYEHYKCQIIAVDPSEAMLQQGRNDQTSETNISWLKGIAEDIPTDDNSVDLVWMSQSFHHIDRRELAFKEICRVTRNHGYLAVRNGVKDHINEIIWYHFSPEVAEIDRNRMPSQTDIINLIVKYDFRLCVSIRFYQYFAESYHEYVDRISRRGLSALITIDGDAFERGLKKLKKWVINRPEKEPVYEPIDLLIFRKEKGNPTKPFN